MQASSCPAFGRAARRGVLQITPFLALDLNVGFLRLQLRSEAVCSPGMRSGRSGRAWHWRSQSSEFPPRWSYRGGGNEAGVRWRAEPTSHRNLSWSQVKGPKGAVLNLNYMMQYQLANYHEAEHPDGYHFSAKLNR